MRMQKISGDEKTGQREKRLATWGMVENERDRREVLYDFEAEFEICGVASKRKYCSGR